jgi:hypothetical protein
LHEYADGSLVAHRDLIDPARGVLGAIGHFLFETTTGRLALYGALGVGVGVGLARLGFGYHRVAVTKLLPVSV